MFKCLSFIPTLLQVFPFVFAFCILCRNGLRKHPAPFYAVLAIIVAAYRVPQIYGILTNSEYTGPFGAACKGYLAFISGNDVLSTLATLFTSAQTGISFFLIVMFIGALRKTPLVQKFFTIRGQMAIMGGIIIFGHFCIRIPAAFYFVTVSNWFDTWGYPQAYFIFTALTLLALPLACCFLVLWITSFRVIRKKMNARTWKKIQKLAYPFVIIMLCMGFFMNLAYSLYGYPFTSQEFMDTFTKDPGAWISNFASRVAATWTYATLLVSYILLKVNFEKNKRKERMHAKGGKRIKAA